MLSIFEPWQRKPLGYHWRMTYINITNGFQLDAIYLDRKVNRGLGKLNIGLLAHALKELTYVWRIHNLAFSSTAASIPHLRINDAFLIQIFDQALVYCSEVRTWRVTPWISPPSNLTSYTFIETCNIYWKVWKASLIYGLLLPASTECQIIRNYYVVSWRNDTTEKATTRTTLNTELCASSSRLFIVIVFHLTEILSFFISLNNRWDNSKAWINLT